MGTLADFGNLGHAAVSGNGVEIENIRMLVYDIDARSTDRTGGTEKDYVFHVKTSKYFDYKIKN